MFKILIVDDDKHLLELLYHYLSENGYFVETTSSAVEGLRKCSEEIWDLVLVDYYMGNMDGNTFLKTANNFKNSNRIAIFTQFANEKIELEVLKNYAVDFIYKTNDPKILLKRIENILDESSASNIKLVAKEEHLVMDIESRIITVNNRHVDLSNAEFNILKLLLENKNTVLSREFIYDNIWNGKKTTHDQTRVIDVHVLNLRKKLGVNSIVTKKGVGYLWKEHIID